MSDVVRKDQQNVLCTSFKKFCEKLRTTDHKRRYVNVQQRSTDRQSELHAASTRGNDSPAKLAMLGCRKMSQSRYTAALSVK